MALWMAWRGVEEGRPVYKAINRLEKKPMAWGTGSRGNGRTLKNPYYAAN
jgi:hypothetical protein